MTETSAFASSLPSHRPLGTPLGAHPTRVLFLGSGELGKEVTIELMRLGAWVCAADSYTGAPAQQVANEARVLDMADAARLRTLFDEVRPDIIVPEVEAIATGELSDAAARGVQRVPSAGGAPKSPPSAWTASGCACSRTRIWGCRPRRTVSPGRWRSCAPGRGRSGTRAWSSR